MISSVRHCKKITSPVNFKTYMSNDYPHLRLTTASEQLQSLYIMLYILSDYQVDTRMALLCVCLGLGFVIVTHAYGNKKMFYGLLKYFKSIRFKVYNALDELQPM